MRSGVVCANCTPAREPAEAMPNVGAANIKTAAIPATLSAFTYSIATSPKRLGRRAITLGKGRANGTFCVHFPRSQETCGKIRYDLSISVELFHAETQRM